MSLLASLPMYDLPEVQRQTDDLWLLLASHLREAGVDDVPDALDRNRSCEELWSDASLLISQSCGFPLVRDFRNLLRPVATFAYGVNGCHGIDYSSAVLVSAESGYVGIEHLRGKICAVNSPMSQSGYNAMRALVAPLARNGRFFSEVKTTGDHRASIASVASDEADVCAVDCVTYALLSRYAPDSVAGVRLLDFTPPCTGLPMVVRSDLPRDQVKRIRTGLKAAISDSSGEKVRAALFIEDVEETEIEDYQTVLRMEARSDALGYTTLR